MTKYLVLGGARSGKSTYAESLIKTACTRESGKLHYIATAIAFDDEMRARIEHHQARRNKMWNEHEVPTELASVIRQFSANDFVLVDCLTVWLNNVIYNGGSPISSDEIKYRVADLIAAIVESPANLVFVSNEVGMGVVPLGEVTRLFVDHAGWMNQDVGSVVENVTLVAAGLPLILKESA